MNQSERDVNNEADSQRIKTFPDLQESQSHHAWRTPTPTEHSYSLQRWLEDDPEKEKAAARTAVQDYESKMHNSEATLSQDAPNRKHSASDQGVDFAGSWAERL